MDEPTNSADLARAIARLSRLTPANRAREARRLVPIARNVLSAEADAAVDEARQGGMSYADLASHLDVGEAMVNKAVTRHRRRLRGETVQDS
jgi:DNA-directed RNA polymerase specialized sigma24 family protein